MGNDRCAGTRHAYVECCHDPQRKKAFAELPQKGSAPPLCEMELAMHGKCVERYLRTSMAKGDDYFFLSHKGQDKCASTRATFTQCLKGNLDIQSGKTMDPTNYTSPISRKSSRKNCLKWSNSVML